MTRKHRSVHRMLWPALALTIAVALAAALYLRPPAPVEMPSAAEGKR